MRGASGLLRDRARLLHVIVIMFISVWFTNRGINWPLRELTKSKFKDLPRGKLCMMINLTMTSEGEVDESYHQQSLKIRLIVLVSSALFDFAILFFCFAALRARQDIFILNDLSIKSST